MMKDKSLPLLNRGFGNHLFIYGVSGLISFAGLGKIQIIEGISILYIYSALTSTCERPEVKFVPGTPGF